MADQSSYEALKTGIAQSRQTPAPPATPPKGEYYESFVDFVSDKDFYKGAHKNEIPYDKEPWRSEQQQAHKRDLELQREKDAKVAQVLAAYPNVHEDLGMALVQHPWLADLLLSLKE